MFANVNGKSIFFDVIGEGLNASTPEMTKKPVFVAIHCASGFDHGYLRRGLDILTFFGQVIYIDLPASGRSLGVDASTVTFENLADDVAAIIDHLGLDKVYLVGHCAGGFVAQHFALRHQEKLKALILVNTSPSFDKVIDNIPSPTLVERAPPDVVEACLTVYGKGIITEETVKACFDKAGPHFLAKDKMDMFQPLVRNFTGISIPMLNRFVNHIYKTYDVRRELHKITVPTLVIAGSQDWLTPPAGSRFIAKEIPNSSYVEFKDSCHISFIELPDDFYPVVHDFIRVVE
ncbi:MULTISPECIES: alpha/beta fold hydrolase [Pantoea]|uniref:3-oxoadipate enol-lactonase/proline iminopeptidase n=1 Tax=Candidatus Pantoea floridensis TaxID=1938870 RepID=A0A286BZT4_9GAMM|nr:MULTISPECIES: alpha/beta hydrolase [Pantoea]PIF22172.1 3-oxoadipate enol-lactonase/proline iminopeptidase [Enterobacteriaceae bacterium JKS000233]PXW18544.1 3-oxoadipate enol-lactonase/proline iminopeptidase [Pantoea sp. JKS000250]SOD39679.1 3-oxoadipate enol-lactonase/proline iminopeptidase [Pantoea floridensis]